MAATTFESLLATVSVQGADKAQSDLRKVRSEAASLSDVLNNLGTLGGLGFLFSQIEDLGRAFANVSGINVAAQFMGIARALQALTGSGDKANKMMQEFKRLGMASAFDTIDVAGMGAKMLGAGVSEKSLVSELSALLDLASHGMGLSREDFNEFSRNLLQIRGRATGRADLADINQMKDRVPQIGNFIAAGLGGGIGREDALKQAQSMTGRELYDTIIKGSQTMAKGAAAAKALLDPVAALGNLFEKLRMSMEPTGKLLLAVLMPLIQFGQSVANVLLAVNKATFGFAGLSALLVGGAGLAYAAGVAAISIGTLTASIRALAVASGMAATTTAATGAGAALVSMGPALLMMLRGGIGAALIGGAAALIGNQIRGDGTDKRRNGAGNLIQGGLTGAGLGFMVGGVPGALAGLLIGTIGAAIYNRMGGDDVANKEENKQVDEQKKTNRLLENIHATQRGGGPRTSAEASRFVAELQLYKFMSL